MIKIISLLEIIHNTFDWYLSFIFWLILDKRVEIVTNEDVVNLVAIEWSSGNYINNNQKIIISSISFCLMDFILKI